MLLENRIRLSQCEATIAKGVQSFYEVGKALIEVQSLGLYREDGYKTFEEYCSVRWDFGSKYAYRLIQSANVMTELAPTGDTMPKNEGQVRELAKVKDPELRAQIWAEVVEENQTITAPIIEAKVLHYIPKDQDNVMDRRVVTYLNHGQTKAWDLLLRGAKEADYLRRVVSYHLKNPDCID